MIPMGIAHPPGNLHTQSVRCRRRRQATRKRMGGYVLFQLVGEWAEPSDDLFVVERHEAYEDAKRSKGQSHG